MNLTRDEKIAWLKLFDEKERRRKNDPIKYFVPHEKQKECTKALDELKKTIIALFWGNRVGKTEWGASTVARILLGQHPDFNGPIHGWNFCPSFDEQKDTTQKKLLTYIPEHKIKDRVWLRKGILRELTVDAGNGRESKLTFKSYEQGREKAQGAGLHFVWFDEEPPKDIYEECFVRQAAGVTLHIFLTMTAIKGMTWVYNDIYLKTNNPDIFVSKAGWDDNPHLTEDQKQKMGRGLSPAALKVRREGEFTKMVGLVCNWFNRSTHLIDIKELPEGDDYFAIDFGFTNPAAGLWVRIDRSFNFWVYSGFYERGLTNPDIQRIIKQKEVGLRLVRRIGDSAQASDIKQLNDNGIKIIGVRKETGTSKQNWDEWRASLMEQQGRIQEATNKPKIFISNDLVAYDENGEPYNFLVKEIENLRWEELKTDNGIEQKAMWGKQPNHAIDALSYIIATIHQPKEENLNNVLVEEVPEVEYTPDF